MALNTMAVEFCTSDIGTIYCKDVDGNDISGLTYKIYDSGDVEITDPANEGNAVKTVVDYMPSFDYMMYGGQFFTRQDITVDVRLWAMVAPDIPAFMGGSEPVAESVNLRFIRSGAIWELDPKKWGELNYNGGAGSNKIRATFKHPTGHQECIMLAITYEKL